MHFFNDLTPERGWGWIRDKEWFVHPLQQLLYVLLAVFPVCSFSQELVEFQNGEVADAQDINANFNVLQDQINSLTPTLGTVAKILGQQCPNNEFVYGISLDGNLLCAPVGNRGGTCEDNSYCALTDGMPLYVYAPTSDLEGFPISTTRAEFDSLSLGGWSGSSLRVLVDGEVIELFGDAFPEPTGTDAIIDALDRAIQAGSPLTLGSDGILWRFDFDDWTGAIALTADRGSRVSEESLPDSVLKINRPIGTESVLDNTGCIRLPYGDRFDNLKFVSSENFSSIDRNDPALDAFNAEVRICASETPRTIETIFTALDGRGNKLAFPGKIVIEEEQIEGGAVAWTK
jgi:hypothetical protein